MKLLIILIIALMISTPLSTVAYCGSDCTLGTEPANPTFQQAESVAVAYGVQIEAWHWKYEDTALIIHLWLAPDQLSGRMVVRWYGAVVVVWEWEPKLFSECRYSPGAWQTYIDGILF